MSGPVIHRNVTPLLQMIRDLVRGVSNDICFNYVMFFFHIFHALFSYFLLATNYIVI